MTHPHRVYVFGPTALVLLFAAHQPIFEVYELAARIAFPAAAIGEANIQVHATEREWEAILLSPSVEVVDPTASAALAASVGPTLGIGHTMCEADRPRGVTYLPHDGRERLPRHHRRARPSSLDSRNHLIITGRCRLVRLPIRPTHRSIDGP